MSAAAPRSPGNSPMKHGREFLSMPLDVTDFDAVGAVTDAVVARRGRIDALVNNAGWSKIEPVAENDARHLAVAAWMST